MHKQFDPMCTLMDDQRSSFLYDQIDGLSDQKEDELRNLMDEQARDLSMLTIHGPESDSVEKAKTSTNENGEESKDGGNNDSKQIGQGVKPKEKSSDEKYNANQTRWGLHGNNLLLLTLNFFKKLQKERNEVAESSDFKEFVDETEKLKKLEEMFLSITEIVHNKISDKKIENELINNGDSGSQLFISPILTSEQFDINYERNLRKKTERERKQLEKEVILYIIEHSEENSQFKKKVVDLILKSANCKMLKEEDIAEFSKNIINTSVSYYSHWPACDDKVISSDQIPSLNLSSISEINSTDIFNFSKSNTKTTKNELKKPKIEKQKYSYIPKEQLTIGFQKTLEKASKAFSAMIVESFCALETLGFKYELLSDSEFDEKLAEIEQIRNIQEREENLEIDEQKTQIDNDFDSNQAQCPQINPNLRMLLDQNGSGFVEDKEISESEETYSYDSYYDYDEDENSEFSEYSDEETNNTQSPKVYENDQEHYYNELQSLNYSHQHKQPEHNCGGHNSCSEFFQTPSHTVTNNKNQIDQQKAGQPVFNQFCAPNPPNYMVPESAFKRRLVENRNIQQSFNVLDLTQSFENTNQTMLASFIEQQKAGLKFYSSAKSTPRRLSPSPKRICKSPPVSLIRHRDHTQITKQPLATYHPPTHNKSFGSVSSSLHAQNKIYYAHPPPAPTITPTYKKTNNAPKIQRHQTYKPAAHYIRRYVRPPQHIQNFQGNRRPTGLKFMRDVPPPPPPPPPPSVMAYVK